MLREITLGQYYPADSPIHKLDPRVKLMGTFVYIISLFLFRDVVGFAVATVFLVSVVRLSKVPFSYMVKGLKSVLALMAVTALFNLFLTPGEHVLAAYGILRITSEGVKNAVFMLVRLICLRVGTSVRTLTTTPNQLTDGLEKALMPLSKVKVPVHSIAMIMSIALRFIPILIEETDIIMKAQMARGADFENGNLIKRVKAMVPLLVPLFVSAFRRADDLAMAMEARCYMGGVGRTKMKPLKYKKEDYQGYLVMAGYLGIIVLWGWFGPLVKVFI